MFTAAFQAEAAAPAVPTVPLTATSQTKAPTSAPEVSVSGTHDNGSASGSGVQDIAQGDTADATSAAAQASSEMDDVQSSVHSPSLDAPQSALVKLSSDTSSAAGSPLALVQQISYPSSADTSISALTHPPPPVKVPEDDATWKELSGLGPKLLSYLKAEMKRGPRLDLSRNVAEYIQTAKISTPEALSGASYLFIKMLKASPSLTLPQLVALRNRAMQAQSRVAATTMPPPMLSASPQPVQTHNALSSNITLAVATPPVTQEEDVNVDISYVIEQLHRARLHIAVLHWAVNFNKIFDLTFSDNALMTKLAKHVIGHSSWGNGDIKTAVNKINAAFLGEAFRIPS